MVSTDHNSPSICISNNPISLYSDYREVLKDKKKKSNEIAIAYPLIQIRLSIIFNR